MKEKGGAGKTKPQIFRPSSAYSLEQRNYTFGLEPLRFVTVKRYGSRFWCQQDTRTERTLSDGDTIHRHETRQQKYHAVHLPKFTFFSVLRQ